MFFLRNRSKVYVKPFRDRTGKTRGAVLAFDGKIRDDLLRRFNSNYAFEGDHIKNDGALSPHYILSLIGSGAGAVSLSSVMSGSLFMATASPSTLMTIGNGVGSAVMGTGGIVGQAPFIPVAGALMPVVVPLIAFQAISTIVIMKQFDGIHKRLNNIEQNVTRIIQQNEATFVGEIISAVNRVEEIEQHFAVSNRFTPEMIIRLSLIEASINPVFERYNCLFQSQAINSEASVKDLQFKQYDAYFAIFLSVLDLRIDLLRLKLAIQEHPGFMRSAAQRLIKKSERYKELWIEIGKTPDAVSTVSTELRQAVDAMDWWSKTMPGWLRGKRGERQQLEEKAEQFSKHAFQLNESLRDSVESAKEIGENIRQNLSKTESMPMNLIYWRDELGEHSYYTDDLQLRPAR